VQAEREFDRILVKEWHKAPSAADLTVENRLMNRIDGYIGEFIEIMGFPAGSDDYKDLRQKSLIKAYSGLTQLKDGYALKPWSRTIARHTVFDWYRSQNGRIPKSVEQDEKNNREIAWRRPCRANSISILPDRGEDEEIPGGHFVSENTLFSSRISPEVWTMARDAYAKLKALFFTLPKAERFVLLGFWFQIPLKHIATLAGMTVYQVNNHILPRIISQLKNIIPNNPLAVQVIDENIMSELLDHLKPSHLERLKPLC
jgi:DNA-directed RNA polymerase specialized sigma24 family protein